MELQVHPDDATYEGDEQTVDAGDHEVQPRVKRKKKNFLQKYAANTAKRYKRGERTAEGGFKKMDGAKRARQKAEAAYYKKLADSGDRGRSGAWQATKGLIRAGTAFIPFTEEAQQLDEQDLMEFGVDNYDINNFDYYLVEKKSSRKKTDISVDKTFNAVGNAIGDTALAIVKVAKDAAHEHAKEIGKSWKVAKGKLGKQKKKWENDAAAVKAGFPKTRKAIGKAARVVSSETAATRRQRSKLDDAGKAKVAERKAAKRTPKEVSEDMDYNAQDVQPNLAVAVQAAIAGEPAAFQGILADALRAKAADALDNYREYVAQSAFSDNEDEDYGDEDEDEIDLDGAEVVAEWADNGDGYDQNDPDEDDESEEEDGGEEFEFDDEEDEDEDE